MNNWLPLNGFQEGMQYHKIYAIVDFGFLPAVSPPEIQSIQSCYQ
jgi:hypothetical protein